MISKCALFSFFILFITAIYSCVSPRYVYTPTAINNPYFVEKGESKLAGFISGGDSGRDSGYVRGYDVMGAYAISNKIALTASYHRRNEQNFDKGGSYNSPFDTSLMRYHRSSWELGAGVFQPLNKPKSIVLNFYSGIGLGKASIAEEGLVANVPYSRFHSANQFKLYFEPGINLQAKAVRFGVSYRFSVVSYSQVSTNYTGDELKAFELNNLENDTQLFESLSFNLQFAIPKLPGAYVEGQVSVATNETYRHVRSFNASAGLVFDIFKLIK